MPLNFIIEGLNGEGKDLYLSNIPKYFRKCYNVYTPKNLYRVKKYLHDLDCVIIHESMLYKECIEAGDLDCLFANRMLTNLYTEHVPYRFFNRSMLSTFKYQLSIDELSIEHIMQLKIYYGQPLFIAYFATKMFPSIIKYTKGFTKQFGMLFLIL